MQESPGLGNLVQDYAANPLLADAQADEILLERCPFRRPTRRLDHSFINFARPLRRDEQSSNASLATHRLLLTIYESELLFLPGTAYEGWLADMRLFYGARHAALGAALRPQLERKAFAFLDREIEITGSWSAGIVLDLFGEFLQSERERLKTAPVMGAVESAILESSDAPAAARHWLIQMAPDFLSEASAMSRLAGGDWGPEQSALFNILADEYGAAVHERKHSALFARTLQSVGLDPRPHRYWQFYQAPALGLTNYFHWIGRDKAAAFRYVGALFYTESSLADVTRRQSALLREVFGRTADTVYFDEHAHIDQHHGAMVLERVIRPLIQRFGDEPALEMLRGFQEFKLLQDDADADLAAQLRWAGRLDEAALCARSCMEQMSSGGFTPPLETYVEEQGERSTTHVHPDDRLLIIELGEMDFWPMAGAPVRLRPGDQVMVPKNRLHGSVVASERCIYHQPVLEPDWVPQDWRNSLAFAG